MWFTRMRRATLVEWDLTGDPETGYGAVVYVSAAPMVVVEELAPVHRTDQAVAAAVDEWIVSTRGRYRLDAEFEAFKALARRLEDGEGLEERG